MKEEEKGWFTWIPLIEKEKNQERTL